MLCAESNGSARLVVLDVEICTLATIWLKQQSYQHIVMNVIVFLMGQ